MSGDDLEARPRLHDRAGDPRVANEQAVGVANALHEIILRAARQQCDFVARIPQQYDTFVSYRLGDDHAGHGGALRSDGAPGWITRP
jgi:hypothetical protein